METTMRDIERCCECDEPTERAGRADDSIYGECGFGPFCSACWTEHLAVCTVCQDMEAD